MTFTKPQKTLLIGGFAGVGLMTAKRFLAGKPIRSAANRERLSEAVMMVDRFEAFVAAERARASSPALAAAA